VSAILPRCVPHGLRSCDRLDAIVPAGARRYRLSLAVVDSVTKAAHIRGVRWLLSIVGLLAAFAVASPAQGSVTIGHVLGTGTPAPLSCFPTCTLRQATLAPEDGLAARGLTSPANGVVTSFGISVVASNQDGNLTIRLRVLRGRTGVATSDPLTLVDADGVQTFATQLPIAVGDGIGIDTLPTNPPGSIGIARGTAAGNSVVELFSPPITDGGAELSPQASPGGVLDMNAVIEPTNTFAVGKVARNKSKGTATVSVTVPNAGALVVSGEGVKRASKSATAPGVVELKIRAKGKKLRTLNKTGKVKVAAKVTFTPSGGSPAARSKKLLLKKKR
jgi:hypothetical protein